MLPGAGAAGLRDHGDVAFISWPRVSGPPGPSVPPLSSLEGGHHARPKWRGWEPCPFSGGWRVRQDSLEIFCRRLLSSPLVNPSWTEVRALTTLGAARQPPHLILCSPVPAVATRGSSGRHAPSWWGQGSVSSLSGPPGLRPPVCFSPRPESARPPRSPAPSVEAAFQHLTRF